MNEYIFYTTEGRAEAPNPDADVDNCQFLGRATGKDSARAKERLLKDNPWIEESGFDPGEILCEQIITDSQRQDIATVVEYLWKDEKRHYEECRGTDPADKCEGHIFNVLKRLKAMCGGRRIVKIDR